MIKSAFFIEDNPVTPLDFAMSFKAATDNLVKSCFSFLGAAFLASFFAGAAFLASFFAGAAFLETPVKISLISISVIA